MKVVLAGQKPRREGCQATKQKEPSFSQGPYPDLGEEMAPEVIIYTVSRGRKDTAVPETARRA